MQTLWMLSSGFCFALMGVFVKLGAAEFSAAELVFYRSLFSLLAMLVLLWQKRLSIRTQRLGMHVHRGVAGFCSLFMFFYAMTALPLATAMTLNYTSPLFLTVLLLCLARERPSTPLTVSIVMGFGGAILLLQPAFARDQIWGGLIGLASGALAAVAYHNVRELVQAEEPEARVVFYFAAVCCLGSLVWMVPKDWQVITRQNAWMLLGIGLTGALGQVFMTRAYGHGKALVAAALSYSGIVFSALLGMVFLGDRLLWTSAVAMVVIVSAGMIAVRYGPGGKDATPQVEND